MSDNIFDKARTLVKRGQVDVTADTPRMIFFTVKDQYDVLYNKKTKQILCTCVSGSLWAVGEECYHAKACLMYMKQKNGDDQ